MNHLARSLRNGLVAEPIDRAATQRVDDRWLAQNLRAAASRFIPVWRDRNLIAGGGEPQAASLTYEEVGEGPSGDDIIYLGNAGDAQYFAVQLPSAAEPCPACLQRGSFRDLRQIGGQLQDFDAALLAYARGMCFWHSQHRYCGACGSPTVARRAGHLRVCENPDCGRSHFPRTDPAVIVLAHAGDLCLLGRKPEWPTGRYSTIAGFVEPGETVEQAVLREVMEEAGIDLAEVTYHSSQPWPFPSSVMLGFYARAASRTIRRNDGELEDARWFRREEIGLALLKQGGLRLPPRVSIARRLIEDWYHERW